MSRCVALRCYTSGMLIGNMIRLLGVKRVREPVGCANLFTEVEM